MKIFFFGRKVPEYYENLLIKADKGLHDQIASMIQIYTNPGVRLLDFGAGEGALSLRLANLGYHVTAVDMEEQLFKAKGIEFRRIDFNNPLEVDSFVLENAGMFDVVCGIEVIEHVENQWQYIRNLKKMLKLDGLIVITTPNITSWISRLIFMQSGRFHQFGDNDLDYGHISPISHFELDLILKKEGFKDITIQPAGTLPPFYFSNFKMIFYSLIAFMLRPFQKGLLDGWCILAIARKS